MGIMMRRIMFRAVQEGTSLTVTLIKLSHSIMVKKISKFFKKNKWTISSRSKKRKGMS